MLVLTIRTDKPVAEIGLFEDDRQLAYEVWTAHRQLAETLHGRIRDIVAAAGKDLSDVGGVACYAGPGSFTGLRIGLTVGNALAYSLHVPIIAQTGDDWRTTSLQALATGRSDPVALPHYGAEVHITAPKR